MDYHEKEWQMGRIRTQLLKLPTLRQPDVDARFARINALDMTSPKHKRAYRRCWRGIWLLCLTTIAVTGSASESPSAIWDGVYTDSQADRGKAAYLKHCAECHAEDLSGQEMAPSLIGVAFSFRWGGSTLNEIYTSLRTTMPQSTPGSLQYQTYADLVAYMLRANNYPSGNAELDADEAALAAITIERKRP